MARDGGLGDLSTLAGARDEDAIQAAVELDKRLGETRSQIEFLARNILAAAHTLSSVSGSLSARDSILDKLEVSARYMSRLNILTRELSDVSSVIGLDMTPVHAANRLTAEEFQRACAVLDDLEEEGDENDAFVEEMDQLIGERSSLINPSMRRIKIMQEAVAHVVRDMFRTSNPQAAAPPAPSTPVKEILNKPSNTPAKKSKLSGHVTIEPDSSPVMSPLGDGDPAASPLLLPDEATEGAPAVPTEMTGWQKARRVIIPLAGGVAGALLLGPAGLVIGFKGATVMAASAAVGASVGALSGTAVSVKLDRDLKATMAQASLAASGGSVQETEQVDELVGEGTKA